MKLTIIQVGQTPESMQKYFDRFPPQFQQLLSANGEDFIFETANIFIGEEFPQIDNLEGIIITGSAYGVYDDIGWIEPLRNFVRNIYDRQIPMLGICFGHQIMADALGGKVEKSIKGWGVGRHIYEVKKNLDFFVGMGDKIALAASHQDQVVKKPEEAEIFLSSDFTPYAGLFYKNGAAISLQPHPEFDAEYSKALIDELSEDDLDREKAKKARLSLNEPLDNLQIGAALARFFKMAKNNQPSVKNF